MTDTDGKQLLVEDGSDFLDNAVIWTKSVRQGAIAKIDNIFGDGSGMTEISTRALDLNEAMKLATFTKEKMLALAQDMPEQNRVQQALGRSKNLIDNRLMTGTLTAGTSPSELITQCLAQIESKRTALSENQNRILKENRWLDRMDKEIVHLKTILTIKQKRQARLIVEIDSVKDTIANLTDLDDSIMMKQEEGLEDLMEKHANVSIEITKLEYKLSNIANDMVKKAVGIGSSIVYVEGCIKEIASFNEMYKAVCNRHGWKIGEWDEMDLMNADIHSKLRLLFTHAKHDIHGHGVIGNGTQHWLEGLGVPVTTVAELTKKHLFEEKQLYDNLSRELPIISNPEIADWVKTAKHKEEVPPIIFNNFAITHPTCFGTFIGFDTKQGETIRGFYHGIKVDLEFELNSTISLNVPNSNIINTFKLDAISEITFGYVIQDVSIEFQEQWLDQMYERFKYAWKPVMDRIGLTSLINEEFVYVNNDKSSESVPVLNFKSNIYK